LKTDDAEAGELSWYNTPVRSPRWKRQSKSSEVVSRGAAVALAMTQDAARTTELRDFMAGLSSAWFFPQADDRHGYGFEPQKEFRFPDEKSANSIPCWFAIQRAVAVQGPPLTLP